MVGSIDPSEDKLAQAPNDQWARRDSALVMSTVTPLPAFPSQPFAVESLLTN